MTQDDVGRRAGIGGKYLSEIERGTRDVPLTTLLAIVERGLDRKLEIRAMEPGRDLDLDEQLATIAALPVADRRDVVEILRRALALVKR